MISNAQIKANCLEKSRRDEVPSVFLSPAEKKGFPFVMSRKSLHCKSLVLGYYPKLPEMFRSSVFLIFRRKNRWKIIYDGSYGKLFSRSFSSFFSADFSIHSFLNNSWGNFVYKRNQGVECHGNHRTQLYQMPL